MPTRLWGFSGHVQTVLHSIVGRVKCPWPLGERVYLSLTDGSTLTYDLYQPLNDSDGKQRSVMALIIIAFTTMKQNAAFGAWHAMQIRFNRIFHTFIKK